MSNKCKKIQVLNQTYTVTEQEDGKYLSIPVVMMVEGVHTGNKGPLLHTAEELEASASNWDNLPVTIQHPQVNGQFVSAATDDEGVKNSIVGKLQNVNFSDGKLRGECWLEVNLLNNHQIIYNYLQSKQPLEVSTGMFTNEISVQGVWNEESYIGIATDYSPDHLALLPGAEGACNWNDGCGIRVNSNQNSNNMKETDFKNYNSKRRQLVELMPVIEVNENLTAKIEALRKALYKLDTDDSYHYMEQAHDDFIIYEENKRGESVKYYKRGYVINPDTKEIEFGEVITEVVREIIFKPININTMSKKEERNTADPKLVSELIANSATKFTEDDREWLMDQEAEMLEKLTPQKVELSKEELTEAIQANQGLSEDDYLAILPEDMQKVLTNAKAAEEKKRTDLIETIQTNAEGVWEENDLVEFSTDKLEKIAKSTGAKPAAQIPDGTGLETNQDGDAEVLYPAGVNLEDK